MPRHLAGELSVRLRAAHHGHAGPPADARAPPSSTAAELENARVEHELELHRRMLGDDIRFDHNVALNRRGGYPGGGWHSHPYVEDEMGPTDRPPSLGLVRTLAYPEGFGAREDGGAKLVPGSHLHRCSEVEPGRWKYPDPRMLPFWGPRKLVYSTLLLYISWMFTVFWAPRTVDGVPNHDYRSSLPRRTTPH